MKTRAWLPALTLATVVSGVASAPGQAAPRKACAAAFVHYERDPGVDPRFKALPWVSARPAAAGIRGRLVYYTPAGPFPPPWVRKRDRALKIYTHGTDPGRHRNMKILWTAGDALAGQRMVVRGRSSTGARFVQTLDVGPSTLNIPRAGCWNLTMTVKAISVTLQVEAFAR
jgi:hypothetical protein